jgi:hypothetical protein
MTLTGPVATTVPATTEPATTQPATTQPATTQPATTQPATTQPTTTAASTESEAVPSTSEPVSGGNDDGADTRTGTIMFIASIAAILGIGAFVVFRSRQAKGRVENAD